MKLKVVAVSCNTNSFGLREMIFISDNGWGFKACANQLNLRNDGAILDLGPIVHKKDVLNVFVRAYNFELGESLSDPLDSVFLEAWPNGKKVSDLSCDAAAFYAVIRIREDKLPGTSLSERVLLTTNFHVDSQLSNTPKRAAEQACVAYCEKLLTTGMFDFYRLFYRCDTEHGGYTPGYFHNIQKEIK